MRQFFMTEDPRVVNCECLRTEHLLAGMLDAGNKCDVEILSDEPTLTSPTFVMGAHCVKATLCTLSLSPKLYALCTYKIAPCPPHHHDIHNVLLLLSQITCLRLSVVAKSHTEDYTTTPCETSLLVLAVTAPHKHSMGT